MTMHVHGGPVTVGGSVAKFGFCSEIENKVLYIQ